LPDLFEIVDGSLEDPHAQDFHVRCLVGWAVALIVFAHLAHGF